MTTINNTVKNLFYRLFFIQGYAINSRNKDGASAGGSIAKTLKIAIKNAENNVKYGNVSTIHYHLRSGEIVKPPLMTIGECDG